MAPRSRPPGDRSELTDLQDAVEELRHELTEFRARPPIVQLKTSWWDQIPTPQARHDANLAGMAWPLVMFGPSNLMFRVTAQHDGIEVMLMEMNVILWQRKLFYGQGSDR